MTLTTQSFIHYLSKLLHRYTPASALRAGLFTSQFSMLHRRCIKHILTTLYLVGLAYPVSADGWDLQYDRDGIRIYTQTLSESSFKAFRGEMQLGAPLKKILAHHIDMESMTEWLYDCVESKLVQTIDEQTFLVYQRTDAPWPVSDRDYLFKARFSQDPEDFSVRVDFEAANGMKDNTDECVRVTQLRGYWKYTPVDPEHTFVEYETHADPAGQVPAWLANQFVIDQPLETLRKLRERLQHNDYVPDSRLDFIKTPEFRRTN